MPVNRAAEGKVKCARALELVGFTTRDAIPRWWVGGGVDYGVDGQTT